MAKDDWFRKKTWEEDDKKDFFAHLKSSRSSGSKAQYLRIQASYLHGLDSDHTTRESLILLDQVLSDYPDSFERSQAFLQKAECLQALGLLDESIASYRAALQSERDRPNVKTNAWLKFGWTVVQYRLRDLYLEVLEILQEFHPSMLFETDKFRLNGIKAIIAHDQGDRNSAREFAQRALGAASQQHSGFRYHPTVGLVSGADKDSEIYEILTLLVAP